MDDGLHHDDGLTEVISARRLPCDCPDTCAYCFCLLNQGLSRPVDCNLSIRNDALATIFVDRLEAALRRSLVQYPCDLLLAADDNDDGAPHAEDEESAAASCHSAITYPVKTDISLLYCQRYPPLQDPTASRPKRSLLGLLEAGVQLVRLDTYQYTFSTAKKAQNEHLSCDFQFLCCCCHGPIWKSWRRTAQLSPFRKHGPTGVKTLSPRVICIDLCRAELTSRLKKPINCLLFLRSLFGTTPTASPWLEDHYGEHRSDCVILILQTVPESLLTFRVSDANPAWYLHSVLRCASSIDLCSLTLELPVAEPSAEAGVDVSDAVNCTVLVYRHLPPRIRLSHQHPVTKSAASLGMLWETLPVPALNGDNVKAELSQEYDRDQQIVMTTRLVCQPYLDALQEYPCLQMLLDHMTEIQQEAAAIQLWTAWPESTHYAKLNDAATVPWTVFPLCYCFPANDASRLHWITQTTAFMPHTTQLLKRMVPDIRTALLSRLEPHALLQAHTGWQDLANHVIRVHLPLKMSTLPHHRDVIGLWVDGCLEHLRLGKFVAFDDSKVHWAFNYSDQERIVLILDLLRPADVPEGTAVGGHSEELDSFIAQMEE